MGLREEMIASIESNIKRFNSMNAEPDKLEFIKMRLLSKISLAVSLDAITQSDADALISQIQSLN